MPACIEESAERVWAKCYPSVLSFYIGAIMPACLCTHRRDHAFAYMNTQARSCLHVYAHTSARYMHTGAITPARIGIHRRDLWLAHICSDRHTYIHTWSRLGCMYRLR